MADQAGAALFITRIGKPGTPARVRADEVYEFIVGPAAQAVGLRVRRADLEPPLGAITPRLVESLVESPVVIADLSGRNPNVFYELGIVHALNVPVVLLIDDAGDLPFDVKDEGVILIGESDRLEVRAARDTMNQLAQALRTALDDDYRPLSTVAEVLGNSRPLPSALQRAIRMSMADVPLYKREQRFAFAVRDVNESIARVRMALSYVLVNPTKHVDTFQATFTPLGMAEYASARVDGNEYDLDDPELRTGRGLAVPLRLGPTSERLVEFAAEVSYRPRDSETFLTYTPTVDYELELSYPAELLRVRVESLLPERAHREVERPGRERYRAHGAVLAYQGLRLDWLPTGDV